MKKKIGEGDEGDDDDEREEVGARARPLMAAKSSFFFPKEQ